MGTDRAEKKPWQFQKGQSGNPSGRPKGIQPRATVMARQLLETRLTAVTKAVLEKAESGDISAARLIFDRLLPVSSTRVEIALPPMKTAEDASKASDMVLAAMTRGEITIEDGLRLLAAIEARVRIMEATEWERGLRALEDRQEL
jgi:Family of unknown function (DUF5681)